MNDEQKIWIAGAYYHYAGGNSYMGIEGYDLFSTTTEYLDFKSAEGDEKAYIVQAQKIKLPSFDNTFNYTQAILAGSKSMDVEDIKLCSMRAGGSYQQYSDNNDDVSIKNLEQNILKLPNIYETVSEIKEVVIPKPIKAMLATFLLEEWNGSNEQIEALRQSTGLDTPNEEFWKPIGTLTAAMTPKDKINYLSNVVGKFGKPELNQVLQDYPQVLENTVSIIKSKLPSLPDEDVQLIATEITSSDYLNGTCAKERFIKFITQTDASFFTTLLESRKKIWAKTVAADNKEEVDK